MECSAAAECSVAAEYPAAAECSAAVECPGVVAAVVKVEVGDSGLAGQRAPPVRAAAVDPLAKAV